MKPSLKRRLWWTLCWVERIRPSTTRNGFKGAVMNVFFLFLLVSPQGIGSMSFSCDVFGINCPKSHDDQTDSSRRKHRWHSMLLAPGRGKGSHDCECHQDFKIGNLPTRHLDNYQVTCDSDFPTAVNKWQLISCVNEFTGVAECHWYVMYDDGNPKNIVELHDTDRWRWHCTNNPRYREQEND